MPVLFEAREEAGMITGILIGIGIGIGFVVSILVIIERHITKLERGNKMTEENIVEEMERN